MCLTTSKKLCTPPNKLHLLSQFSQKQSHGKYATNGLHAQRGYDFAVERINSMGGVKVGGKTYMLSIKYYDDESTPARGAQLAERLIKQDGV